MVHMVAPPPRILVTVSDLEFNSRPLGKFGKQLSNRKNASTFIHLLDIWVAIGRTFAPHSVTGMEFPLSDR